MLAVATLIAGLLLAPSTAPAPTGPVCQERTFGVHVAGQHHTVAGTLCTPPNARTLQILVPGGLYNSSYWDIAATMNAGETAGSGQEESGAATFSARLVSVPGPEALAHRVLVQRERVGRRMVGHEPYATARPRPDRR
jgi:hypothetical protein